MNSFLDIKINNGRAAFMNRTGSCSFEVVVFALDSGQVILRAWNDHKIPVSDRGLFLLTKDNLYVANDGMMYCARFAI